MKVQTKREWLKPRVGARGFSLIELLVVIVIMGILITLLMPMISSAWETASLAVCKTHLGAIFKAQSMWRAERNSTLMVSGGNWMGRISPYVENNTAVFLCPAAPLRGENATSDTSGSSSSGGGSSGSISSGGSEVDELSMEFDIYYQEGSIGDTVGGTHVRAGLAWTIPVSSHPWVRRTESSDSVLYEVDDEGSTGGFGRAITFDDIKFKVYYEHGQPKRVEILKAACGTSPYDKYIYDFRVNGEVVITEWVKSIGQTFDIEKWTGGSGVVLGDYGLSRGTYETAYVEVNTVDAKLFFILDYAKSVANYSDVDEDIWHKYFITDEPAEWDQQFGGPDVGTYAQYQALRHGGRANVLFCDGHIETLEPSDLAETSPFWKYGAR